MKEVLLSLVLLLDSQIAGWGLWFSHPRASVHLRHLRFTICEYFAWALHGGTTTDASPTSWNPASVSEALKSLEDKTMRWTKGAYPGAPKTDKAPAESVIQIFSSPGFWAPHLRADIHDSCGSWAPKHLGVVELTVDLVLSPYRVKSKLTDKLQEVTMCFVLA